MLGQIKSSLGQLGSNYEAVALTFPKLDLEKIRAKFRLSEEGESSGKANIPPTEAMHFDHVEQKIIAFLNEEVNAANEQYHDHMRSFEQRITGLHEAGHAGSMEGITIKAEGEILARTTQDASILHTARVAVTESQADLNRFKEENGLVRSARYPASRFLYYAIAGLLLMFETGFNGFFFAKGSELGLLGGGFTALIPSLLNVCAGYFLGNYGFRLAIHKNSVKKYAGQFLCLCLPIVVFILNLLIAHYRSAMMDINETGSAEAAITAIRTFIAGPFDISDIESWLLLATGCVFSLIATLDFWKMDDGYFHYGDISRDHENKMTIYASAKQASIDTLSDMQSDYMTDLEDVSNLVHAKLNEANAIVNSQQRWKALYPAHLTYLEGAGRELLSFYRTSNMKKRSAPPPAYFLEQWSMPRPQIIESGTDFDKVIEGFEKEAQTLKEVYAACVQRIGTAYQAALTKYQTITQLQPE